MTVDSQIQLQPFLVHPWQADIAPCAPQYAGWKTIPGSHNVLAFTEGTTDPEAKKYPGVLFSPAEGGHVAPRAIGENTGHCSLSVGFTIGADGIANGNVFETDLILVTNGLKFNLSGQRHIADGRIDIGNWTDTTLRAGAIQADRFYVALWTYSFNVKGKTCSVASYSDTSFMGIVPGKCADMPATPCDWKEGAYLQIQLGSKPAGLPWQVRIGDISLRWW